MAWFLANFNLHSVCGPRTTGLNRAFTQAEHGHTLAVLSQRARTLFGCSRRDPAR